MSDSPIVFDCGGLGIGAWLNFLGSQYTIYHNAQGELPCHDKAVDQVPSPAALRCEASASFLAAPESSQNDAGSWEKHRYMPLQFHDSFFQNND